MCYSFGYDSLVISNDTCDLYHPSCLAAAKDSFFKVNIKREDLSLTINNLKEKG